MKKFFQKYWWGGLGLLLFIAYSALVFTTPKGFFNSPDENANFVFIKEFITHDTFTFSHSNLLPEIRDFVFPRSTYAQNGVIRPIGFWGLLFLYGTIGKVITSNGILFLTPLLAVLGLGAFYKIIFKLFSQRVALVSTLLLALHPAWWYYTARGLFPNITFIVFLLFALFFFFVRPQTRFLEKFGNDFLGMFFLGIALLIRPSEVWWVGISFVIVSATYRKSLSWKQFGIWSLPVGILGILYYFVNHSLYGGVGTGYLASASYVPPSWYSYIFPFGIHPRLILSTFYFFFVRLIWWYTIPTFFGLIYFFKHYTETKHRVYALVAFFTSIFLVIFYGSHEDSLRGLQSIGISYVRYWLPIYIFSLPLIAILLQNLKRTKQIFVCIIFFALNISLTFGGPDGILRVKENILHAANVRQELKNKIPDDAIIATEFEDKYFWSDYAVMKNVTDPDIVQAMNILVEKKKPVYFFAVKNGKEEEEVKKLLGEKGISLEEIFSPEPHVLYQVKNGLTEATE